MKRKVLARVVIVAVLAVTTATGMGCGNKDTSDVSNAVVENTQQAGEENQTEQKSYTVTFYDSDGTSVLNVAEVADGECVEDYVPKKEGSIFVGWFATPQMSHKFDFTTPITADASAFAGFVTYVKDEREFAIVGSGTSPVLMESNWGAVIGEAQKMVKEDSADKNIYTLTLDLNVGDEFQFAINSEWNNQRGYGYLDTIAFDGEDYFENSGGLGDVSTKRSNIKCAVAGNYTFTLGTYPGEDQYETDNANYSEENKEAFNMNSYDTISWTYNGSGQTADVQMQTDYYIKGAQITGWEDVYTDETKFTEENGIYTLEVKLTKGDEFMFTSMVTSGETTGVGTEYIRYTNIAKTDTESLSYVSEGGGANLIAEKEGTYVFTYDPSTKVLTVSAE